MIKKDDFQQYELKNNRNYYNMESKTNWMTKTIFWVAVVAIVICAIGIIVPGLNIKNDNSIITFIGILATFVVISNFSQVADIRNNTENELRRMRKMMEDSGEEIDKELGKMKKELHETSIKLSEMDSISQRIISSFFVDINRIKLKIGNEKINEDETVLLLDELMAYEGVDDDEIRRKIVDVLNSTINKAAESSEVAAAVFDIASMVSPMHNKTNDSLGSLFEIGFEIIDMALWKNNPKSSEYGFTIIKRITRIDNKYRKEGKDCLNSLKRKLKEETKIKFVETLIHDLDNNDLRWPAFDKDVQEWIDKNE